MANLKKQVDVTHSRSPVALAGTERLAERLLARIEKTPNGCWEWSGSRDVNGYGWIHYDGRTVKTHRASFATFVRQIEDGEAICHRCDNPPCLNPAHLFVGSHLDNMRDMAAKGRRRPDRGYIKGETHHQAKITEADVRTIRARRADGATYNQLMRDYPLSKTNIADICNRKTWKHLT